MCMRSGIRVYAKDFGSLQDGPAAYQLVGGVTAHQGFDG